MSPVPRPRKNPTAGAIMTRSIVSVDPRLGLQELAQLFVKRRISGVPVVDELGAVLGVVSKTDLAKARAMGENLVDHFYGWASASVLDDEYDPYADVDTDGPPVTPELTVRDIMNKAVYKIETTATLRDVAREMRDKKIHRLLVTEGGRFVGIVSGTDVIRAVAES